MKLIIGLIAIIILLAILGLKWFTDASGQPCLEPDKPEVVPSSAVWKGGCDGGSWIQLIESKQDKFRFRIYHDHHGELLLDADFYLEDCGDFFLTKSNWTEYVSWYSGQFIGIRNLGENNNWQCKLRPKFPAYGGEEWEIIKDKEGH